MQRNVLIVTHTRRLEAIEVGQFLIERLVESGITPVMSSGELNDYRNFNESQGATASTITAVKELGSDVHVADLELAVVFGGDGTILKAAEIVRESAVPLMGINLGHVGFLADSEREEIESTIQHIIERSYQVTDRLTLDVEVQVDGKTVYETWALNEATVEKSSRERMLEVVLEIDGQPLSSFGCDGMIVSTPTGSTAYAFSAGGPIVWPTIDALLVVPLSAHALFAKPLVVHPEAQVAVEVLQRSVGSGTLWCDGRRSTELPAGARVQVSKSKNPVRLASVQQTTFTKRLVQKFALPVAGWRGPAANERV
ncbi:NAD kinase [Candidatus Rhodoluna planktonica]|uniref:NAD kinase n=1 Tax=Candidatus Rhodoluna planktonica TaxID=535712 RepID=A0A1D9DZJ9_9MICO|nr:NAD kinase [Candidatus Rhodoluna planktonica]AOY56200.1 NAD kinase [Candidatus Rhodoluna planktonica]